MYSLSIVCRSSAKIRLELRPIVNQVALIDPAFLGERIITDVELPADADNID